MTDPQLFYDDITLESERPDAPTPADAATFQSHYRLLGGLTIAGVIVVLWFALGSIFNAGNRGSLTLAGDQVGQLRPGATVTLDGMPVGKVDQVEVRDGLPSARLQIDPDVLKTIPQSSRFEVGSLNRVLPGNIGVKIITSGRSGNETSTRIDLESMGERLADRSILPAGTPLGFYLVLFGFVVIGILVLGFVIKVIKSASFWTAILAAFFIVVLHAWYTGKLDDATFGRQEHGNPSQKSTQVFP